MIDLLRVILLGIIEGITEFLPISSTGHLLIAERFGLGARSDLFNIGIQAGAILAVTLIYWKRIWQLFTQWQVQANRDYLFKLIVAYASLSHMGTIVLGAFSFQAAAAHGALEWQQDIAVQLAEAWMDAPRPDVIVAASVVDAARESRLAEITQRAFACTPLWVRTPTSACGVRNAYAEPRRLGVDRFLAMVAAHAAHRTPCVLISAGTALALDALSADGQHLGGLIAPGIQLMQQSLQDATALIRPPGPGDILELADNTADAVTSGCWQAGAALVERFHTRMLARFGATPALILHGGDAQQLASMLSMPVVLARDGVLHGLALWADTHLASPPSI